MEKTILVVDDSCSVRQHVSLVLQRAGFETAQAADGQEGLAMVDSNRNIDMVICDINMPNMDGIQLLHELKASVEYRHIPVIMITTEGGESKVMEAVQLGATGYVRKPFTADQIKEKLSGLF